MIKEFILYCTSSITQNSEYASATLSIKVTLSSWESLLSIVGGSCLWSPAKISFLPSKIGIQQLASKACAASSITTKSNPLICLAYSWRNLELAETLVARTTWQASKTSVTASFWRSLTSLLSSLISDLFSREFPLFLRMFLWIFSISLRASEENFCCWVLLTKLSKEYFIVDSINRAGCPTLQTFTFPPSLSTMLSTAMLEGAVASTLRPLAVAWRISSTTVVVLPVPGGP
mmetsp:Transcript_6237/g.9249  ORF Transcript_6237/g.9249 Transcript_6237/m.9249 type:complete len:232 (-) Transcript_6237:573-1268(-)